MTDLRLERGRKQILVADDSETYRSIALRVLADAGYEVAGASDGAEAVKRLTEEGRAFDLLILELNLPRLRGLEVLRRVLGRPEQRDLRVLVVSDSLTQHLRRILSELRLDATLTKNHALRELLYEADALLLTTPADARRSPRRLIPLPVNYWIGQDLYLQSCFDLGESGMFVVVADDPPPPVGTRLALRFWLPNADHLVVCEGVVVWLNGAAGDLSMSHPPGMGVRFTSISERDAALVRAYLDRSG